MTKNKAWAWLATHLEAGSNLLVYQVGDSLTQPVLLGPDSRMASPSEMGTSGLSTSSNAHELMTYVTHDVSLWDKYIWIIGGATMITPGNELPENTVNIHRPEYFTTVKRTDPNRADKLIGVHTAATQQNKTKFQYLSKK
eukprot:11156680-Ditylum_brightwellii.AAC.1